VKRVHPALGPIAAPSRPEASVAGSEPADSASGARFRKLVVFLASGLPSFLLAIPANYFLVERAGAPPAPAYAAILAMQVSLNFFVCRWLVFGRTDAVAIVREFRDFVAGILLFRLADWAVYVVLVDGVGLYYLAVQLANVVLFALLKFWFAERVFLDASGRD
jgi:putative flippase GtrA